MTDDIVQDVVKPAEEEQTATGVVDGVQVSVSKESYTTLTNHREWKVKATSSTGHRSQESGLSHEKANEQFEELVEEYDLEQQE